MCWSWFYKAVNPHPRKANHLSLATGDMVYAWIAIEYSYKTGQKYELKFLCELGWFLQRQSHLIMILILIFDLCITISIMDIANRYTLIE